MNKNPQHSCQLPSPNSVWTIHGIWPTKMHTMGPFSCNKTWEFDDEAIEPIRSELEQQWTNIQKGNNNFLF